MAEKELKKVKPIEIVPDNPNNIRLSKAEFVAQERKRKEDNLKIKEFAETLKKKEIEVTPPIKTEAPEKEKKVRGRPKKIE